MYGVNAGANRYANQSTHAPQSRWDFWRKGRRTAWSSPVWNLGIQDLHPLVVRVEAPNQEDTSNNAVERNRKVPHA